MAAFSYRAVDAAGRSHSGVIEAASAVAARQELRGRGLIPLAVAASRSGRVGTSVPFRGSLFNLRAPLGGRELALVTRQLAMLIGSGVRVEDALRAVADGSSQRTAAVLLNVRAAVLDGQSFGQALAEYPSVFSDYFRASVRAGEQAGQLGRVMEHLATFAEDRSRTAQSVRLALVYPALLALVSLGIVALLLIYVIPDIVRAFAARGADLPWLTRALIAASAATRDWGLPALGLTAAAALGFRRWLSLPKNRLRLDRRLARSRATAGLVTRLNAVRFTGTLATLVRSGVPLTEALSAAAAATPNRFLRQQVEEATSRVREGSSLRNALAHGGWFPPMLLALVASGEAGGTLGETLARAAAHGEQDLEAWTRTVVALVEPAILLIMGGVVLVMVLAILLPIVSMNALAGA